MLRWLTARALMAVFPRHAGLPGIADCQLDAFLAQLIRDAPLMLRLSLYAGVLVYHLTPLLTIFVPLPALLLPARLRDRHVHTLVVHPIYLVRQSVFLLKTVGGLCWGADPTVRERLALAPYPADPRTVKSS